MKDLDKLQINYIGYKEPESVMELEIEIAGLRTAIAFAQQRIAVLEQSLKIRDLIEQNGATKHETTIDQGTGDSKTNK